MPTDLHLPGGGTRFKDMNQLLRLLVENEISRLSVWRNPMNDGKRGIDHTNYTERSLSDVCINLLLHVTLIDHSIGIVATPYPYGLEDRASHCGAFI